MCIGGRLGADLDLDKVSTMEELTRSELLYSESASRLLVSVKPEFSHLLETLGLFQTCRKIGEVTNDGKLTMRSGSSIVLQEEVEELASAFKAPLAW